jgi:sugar phosphate isomerase/epimerase
MLTGPAPPRPAPHTAKYPAPPTAQGRANCVAALRELAPISHDLGVTLALEVINRWVGWGVGAGGLGPKLCEAGLRGRA